MGISGTDFINSVAARSRSSISPARYCRSRPDIGRYPSIMLSHLETAGCVSTKSLNWWSFTYGCVGFESPKKGSFGSRIHVPSVIIAERWFSAIIISPRIVRPVAKQTPIIRQRTWFIFHTSLASYATASGRWPCVARPQCVKAYFRTLDSSLSETGKLLAPPYRPPGEPPVVTRLLRLAAVPASIEGYQPYGGFSRSPNPPTRPSHRCMNSASR